MKRRLALSIVGVVVLVSVSTLVYQKSVPGDSLRADAIRMWSGSEQSNDREHELKALATKLKENPDHAPILLRMAQVARELGKTAEAVGHLREAVKVDAKNVEAKLELGRALFESGDVHGAIDVTNSLLELDPGNTDGLYNLGAIYGNLGMEDRAREYWKKAVAADPSSDSGRRATNALKQIGG